MLPFALPVPKPSLLNLMPVLPSVIWSAAVRIVDEPVTALAPVRIHGVNSAVPASAVDVLINCRRVTPQPAFDGLFWRMKNN